MFELKHIMVHSTAQHSFESDMPYGINYDFFLISQTPILVRVDESFLTDSFLPIGQLMRAFFLKIQGALAVEKMPLHYTELNQLRQRIYNHPEYAWTLPFMAEQVHMSPRYLHTLYKELFSTTCVQDVIASRVQKAKHLLRYSKQNISQIASEYGYNNIEHFYRQFQKETGEKPSHYREMRSASVTPSR